MITTKGNISEDQLRKEVLEEQTPAGKCVTTRWFLDEEVVKQDIDIVVDPNILGAKGGL